MTLSITQPEQDFLWETLNAKRDSMLHELHHTDTGDFKNLLKQKLEIIEGLLIKFQSTPTSELTGRAGRRG